MIEMFLKALQNTIDAIAPLDEKAVHEALFIQENLAKPPKSLGKLEDISVQLAGITGNINADLSKKRLLVFASDNGVVEEGISSAPQSVTLSQTINLTRGMTGAATLSRFYGNELFVYDVGVNADIREEKVINKKIAYGTRNIAKKPAMTREEALRAILVGIEAAVTAKADDVAVIGVGEMGIGNTTTAAAVLSVLTGCDPAVVTGKGGGLTEEAYLRKIDVIRKAIAVNLPDADDVIDVLAKVGGFDICAMTGAYLGAAAERMPAVIDGFISVVAALCAARLCPQAKEYMIASHESSEQGYRKAIGELGLSTIFDLKMRLGEGSGCPLAFRVIDAAWFVLHNMASFDEAEIDDAYLSEIRKIDAFTVKGDK